MKSLYSKQEVIEMIDRGEPLLLSGDEFALKNLPKGNWIAGTIPYFMSEKGGILSHDEIQVAKLPSLVTDFVIKTYSVHELMNIPKDYLSNGFSYIIIPAFSKAHITFAKNCMGYEGLFYRPLIGWVSGFDLAEFGKTSAKVFNGMTGEVSDADVVVMHLDLPKENFAKVNIVNLFEQGTADAITFDSVGFEIGDCFINGKKTNFSNYLFEKKIDVQLPLVADYMGAMINVSFQEVDAVAGKVKLYAPVFPGIEYKIAKPVGNYEQDFLSRLERANIQPYLSCNCILNYLYAKLEGKTTGHIVGPMTFGEIAYILLNQTMVYLTIE